MWARLCRRVRLQTLLFLAFLGLCLGLLALLGTVVDRVAEDTMVRSAGVATLANLQDAADRLGLRLAAVTDTALALSIDTRLGALLAPRGHWDEARALLEVRPLLAQYARRPEIAGVHVAVRGWRLAPSVTNGIGIIAEESLYHKAWYAPALQFDEGWLGLHANDIYPNSPDAEVVTYVRRLYSQPGGEALGAVLVDVRLPALHRALAAWDSGSSLFLARASGDYFYQVSGPPVDREAVLAAYQRWAPDQAGHVTLHLPQGEALVLYTAPTTGGWRLVQVVPMAVLTAGMERIRTSLVLGGAACAALSLVLSWVLARLLARPVDQLAAAMRRVAEGDLQVRVPVGYQREIAALQRGFNHMVERLQTLVAELEAQHRQTREAELAALQAQINPHFLYNTLDTINWMAIAEGQHRISEAIALLGRFFRLALGRGDPLIPLAHELDHVRVYIRLQQLRWPGRFRVEESFPPEVLRCQVPRVLLQPFVENALIHGLAHREAGGLIALAGRLEGDALVLTVADNGAGLPPGGVPPGHRTGTGYGVRNVHDRIQLLFGPAYGVELCSSPGQGTTVRIRLPVLVEGGEVRVVRPAG